MAEPPIRWLLQQFRRDAGGMDQDGSRGKWKDLKLVLNCLLEGCGVQRRLELEVRGSRRGSDGESVQREEV